MSPAPPASAASRAPRAYLVLGFGSAHAALDAEALLEDLGVAVTPIPAPKVLGSICGIALRLEPVDGERATQYLGDAGIEVSSRAEIEDL